MTTTEKMTVHKALAELKIIDDRIVKSIYETTFVTANKHSNEKITGVPIADFKENMKSGYQKVNDLIERRNALKRAVVLSNATTKINIGGVDYTVAEAIDMKNHGMDLYKTLRHTMNDAYVSSQVVINANGGEVLERRAEQYITSVIAAQPKDSKMTVDSDLIKKLRQEYIANNTYDLIDPININIELGKLSDMIAEFETEIDAALSVSNALTVIEFTY